MSNPLALPFAMPTRGEDHASRVNNRAVSRSFIRVIHHPRKGLVWRQSTTGQCRGVGLLVPGVVTHVTD